MTPSGLDHAARAAMAQGNHAQAKQIVDRLLAQHPSFPPGWLTASILALQCRNPAGAATAAANGLAIAPTDPALLVQNIRCLHASCEIPAALAAAHQCATPPRCCTNSATPAPPSATTPHPSPCCAKHLSPCRMILL
jgi:hypothetical protein